jgi:N-methylhydantoinase B
MSPTLSIDPVTFEVVRSGLYSICEEMKSAIMRASFSPLLSLSADLSCAIVDHAGDVVAQGNDIPVHLGAMPFTARGMLEQFPLGTWEPGDAVLTNDPYVGGVHLPDMTLMLPVFDGAGIIGFTVSRVHWPDVGGAAPGSSTVTDDILNEGLRVPPIKIARNHVLNDDLVRLILANVRVPGDRFGDLKAQFGGNQRAVLRIAQLIARYGGETVQRIFADSQAYSQLKVEEVLEALPDGRYSYHEHMDGDGYSVCNGDDGFKLAVTIDKQGRSLVCDFTGSSGAVRGPINMPLSVASSAVYYVLLCLTEGKALPNSGAYRPARIIAPEGSIANARYPSPVVASNTEAANRLVDVLLGALAPAMPDRAIAGSYGSAAVYTLGGRDHGRGRTFVHYETVGGGAGAAKGLAGVSGQRVHMGNTMNLPIEAMEAALPLRFDEYALIRQSGGTGRWRGGDGVRKAFRILSEDVRFSLLCERGIYPAQGIAGGAPGRCARFSIRKADGSVLALQSKTTAVHLGAGDTVVMETAGGGGWGASGEPGDEPQG